MTDEAEEVTFFLDPERPPAIEATGLEAAELVGDGFAESLTDAVSFVASTSLV